MDVYYSYKSTELIYDFTNKKKKKEEWFFFILLLCNEVFKYYVPGIINCNNLFYCIKRETRKENSGEKKIQQSQNYALNENVILLSS